MATQELLDKIARLPQRPADVPTCPPKEVIAFAVRWNRSLRQWKISTLAHFARVSVSTVERVERGQKVNIETLDRIAQAFGYKAGYFTRPRLPLGTHEALARMVDAYSNLEAVPVAPMTTHRAVREAARCDAFLIHRPEVPDTYDVDIETLTEWLDLASFMLSNTRRGTPAFGTRPARSLQ